jgi:hypothetical protein
VPAPVLCDHGDKFETIIEQGAQDMMTPVNNNDLVLIHQQMQKERIREADNWRLSQSVRAQTERRRFLLPALLSWLRRLPLRAPRLQPQVADSPVFTRRVRQQS